jgi:hypothetical protein
MMAVLVLYLLLSLSGSFWESSAAELRLLGNTLHDNEPHKAEYMGASEMTKGHGRETITAQSAQADVVPDGNLEKPFWVSAGGVHFDHAAFSDEKYPQMKTIVASRWTAKYLYIAVWCHYEEINVYAGEDPERERWELWKKDVVEVFINPQPDNPSHYYEFEIAPNNQWLDLAVDLNRNPISDPGWNSGFEHATAIDAKHHVWTTEMRIPISALTDTPIDEAREWRVNFYRCEGPGNDETRRMLSWRQLPFTSSRRSFHQPAFFGALRFSSPATTKQSTTAGIKVLSPDHKE